MRYDPYSTKHDFSGVTMDEIKQYFFDNNYGPHFSMFEAGIDDVRFDMIRINPYKEHIRIFEFKSGRPDFVSDKKWQRYLPYCHTFTFVCPVEAIRLDDLPSGIGLLWIYKWTHKQHADPWPRDGGERRWRLQADWQRRPKGRMVNSETKRRIAFRLLHKVKFRGGGMCFDL